MDKFRKKLVNDSQNTSSRCNGQRRSRPIRLQPCNMLGRLPLRGSTVFLPPPCSTRRLLRVQNRRHASLHRCNLPRALLARTRSHTIRRRKLIQSLMCRARHLHHGPRLCRTNRQRIPSCCRSDSQSSHYPSHSTQICTRSCCDFAHPSSWQSPCWTQGTEFCLRQQQRQQQRQQRQQHYHDEPKRHDTSPKYCHTRTKPFPICSS